MIKKILIKKNSKIENLKWYNSTILYIINLTLRFLFIITNIIINHN